MVRRYEEPIEVREGAREDLTPGLGGVAGLGPDAFVWRGRLYVVRAVLDRWQERRPWWRDAREREGRDVLTDARKRQVWRVEASAGRSAGVGVYDLCADHTSNDDSNHDNSNHDNSNHDNQWRLLRVAD